ncbi:hypothetical protein PG984_000040 [Apiospora sp. TS-2023a]
MGNCVREDSPDTAAVLENCRQRLALKSTYKEETDRLSQELRETGVKYRALQTKLVQRQTDYEAKKSVLNRSLGQVVNKPISLQFVPSLVLSRFGTSEPNNHKFGAVTDPPISEHLSSPSSPLPASNTESSENLPGTSSQLSSPPSALLEDAPASNWLGATHRVSISNSPRFTFPTPPTGQPILPPPDIPTNTSTTAEGESLSKHHRQDTEDCAPVEGRRKHGQHHEEYLKAVPGHVSKKAKTAETTPEVYIIDFADGLRHGLACHNHMIVQHSPDRDEWRVLRCDDRGLPFDQSLRVTMRHMMATEYWGARRESDVDIESIRDSSESEDMDDSSLELHDTRRPSGATSFIDEPDVRRGCAAAYGSKSPDGRHDTTDGALRASSNSLAEIHAYSGPTDMNHAEAMSLFHSNPKGPGNSRQNAEDLSTSSSQQLLPPELPGTVAASPLAANQEAPDLGSTSPPLHGTVRCQQERVCIVNNDHLMLSPRPLPASTSSEALRRESAEQELSALVSPKTTLGFVLNDPSHTVSRDGAGTASEPLDDLGATVDLATAWPPLKPSVNSNIHSPDHDLLSIDYRSSNRQDQVGHNEASRLSSNVGLIQSEIGATDYWQERVNTDAKNWVDVLNATERRKIQNRQSQWRHRQRQNATRILNSGLTSSHVS